MPNRVYVVGSLRNPEVPKLAAELRELGIFESVFDDWHSAGPHADDCWRDYEKARGHTLQQALRGTAARNIFNFDCRHLVRADIVIMLMPAGKSAHLELGWAIGRGAKGYILLDADPDRYDVMMCFAEGVFASREELFRALVCEALRNDLRVF